MSEPTQELAEDRRFDLYRVVLWAGAMTAVMFGLARAWTGALSLVVTEGSTSNYLIASWRPIGEDAELIAQISPARRVRYLRGDHPFVQGLAEGVNLGASERRGLVVFSGESCVIGQLAGGDDPLGDALGLARAESERRRGSRLPLGLLLGGVAGLWLRFGPRGLVGAMALGSGLSLYQFATACPTCPATRFAGVPLAIWGASLYAGLALALATPRSAALAQRLVGPIAACVAGWQMGASTLGGVDCLPCAFVAALNAMVAASALAGGLRVRRGASRPRLGRTLVAVAGCGLAALGIAKVSGTETLGEGGQQAAPLTLIGLPLSDLGLEPSGRPEAVMLGNEACAPCADALRHFIGRPDLPIRLAFVGDVPVEAGARGERLGNPSLVRSTPTFVFTDSQGRVVGELPGWDASVGKEIERRVLRWAAGDTAAREGTRP